MTITQNNQGLKTIPHKGTIQRVLLVQPPAFTNNARQDMNPNPPLGIAYIAAILEQAGYEVRILDAFIEGWDTSIRINHEKLLVGLPYDEIEDYVRDYQPDFVGITSMFTSQRKNAHKVAEVVKKVDRKIPVIFGGAHPTAAPESVIDDENVDFAVLGEGDNLIVPLIEAIKGSGEVRHLNGLAYKDDSGNNVVVEKVDQIENLDEIPYPARHLLPIQKYFDAGIRHGGSNRGSRALSMITSRGCVYKCNFCTAYKVFTRRTRLRSAENVIGEIQQMVDDYGIDEIWFEDDQILAKRNRIIKLLDILAEKFNLMWDTPNGVSPWILNEELLEKMKKSGCYRVNLAIESGNQEVLDEIINKPVKLEQIPGLIELLKKYELDFSTFLVIGNISRDRVETVEEIKDSFRFARELKVIPHVSLLTAYPGSEVLDVAEEKGYLIPEFDWDNLIIQKSQLQTPNWDAKSLMSLTKREILKTKLYIYLTDIEIQKSLVKLLITQPSSFFKKLSSFSRQVLALNTR